jgi:MFS family permease
VSTVRAWLRSARMDTTPLRTSRDFRLLFAAGTVFYLGGMVSYVAVPYQLYHLTHSNLAVGAMGAVELVPLLVFGLYGGALADHADRRTVLVLTGVAQAVLTAALMANAFLHRPAVWVIYVVGGLLSVAQSLQRPSREALTPRVVSHEELPAAVALSSIGGQIGQLGGPALGGLLVATAGAGAAYAVDVTGLVIATTLFLRLHRYPATEGSNPPSLSGISEGIRYAARRKDLLGTYLIDIIAMFMAFPIVLFPALAADVFRQPALLGLLYTAESIGTLLATATSGWTRRVHHHGRAVAVAATAYGLCIAAAGLAPNAWVAIAFLAAGGAADMMSALFRQTIWHQTIPDGMRGRLAGIEMLSYSIGPLGGQARAGLVADLTSVRASIVSGGLLCAVGVAATATFLRSFWSYDERTDEHAVRERQVRAARAAEARAAEA